MENLKEYATKFKIDLTTEHLTLFKRYYEFLIEYNKKVNLTAIIQKEEAIIKHFLDSISLLNFVDLKQHSKIIDIGTGAGFPGLPLKIVRPDLEVVLLDSRYKRLEFVKQLLSLLEIDCQLIHANVKETSCLKEKIRYFDFIVSRAALSLSDIAKFCTKFLNSKGTIIAYKGYNISDELQAAKPIFKALQLKVEVCHKFLLPNQNKRSILLIKKL